MGPCPGRQASVRATLEKWYGRDTDGNRRLVDRIIDRLLAKGGATADFIAAAIPHLSALDIDSLVQFARQDMGLTSSKRACCSSPASMCYWFAASLIAWGLLSLVGLFWHPLGPGSASTILLAAGIGCVANWTKNRIFHCGITAPLLLIAGTVFLLSDIGILNVPPRLVWALVGAGVCVAFLLEWRYASADSSPSKKR